jgi:putative transposase
LADERGEKAAEICRKVSICEETSCTCNRKYTRIGLGELRARALRDENAELKELTADLSLERHMLREIV